MMRTIASAAQYFRDNDPNTAVTAYAIRQAVRRGDVPSMRAGTKYLVAVENLAGYFAGGITKEEPKPGGIRLVKDGGR